MIFVIGLIVLALIIAARLVEPDEANQDRPLPRDPRDDLPIWALLGRR
jgi:hypothetical protein